MVGRVERRVPRLLDPLCWPLYKMSWPLVGSVCGWGSRMYRTGLFDPQSQVIKSFRGQVTPYFGLVSVVHSQVATEPERC